MPTFKKLPSTVSPAAREHVEKQLRARARASRPDGMNRDERAYAEILEARRLAGEIREWKYARMTFKVGDDCRYTPDFTYVDASGEIWCVEVKGFLRDDAQVKFKTAADQFPWAHWLMVRRKSGVWETVYEL